MDLMGLVESINSQLMVDGWFGARWFGILGARLHIVQGGPCHKELWGPYKWPKINGLYRCYSPTYRGPVTLKTGDRAHQVKNQPLITINSGWTNMETSEPNVSCLTT